MVALVTFRMVHVNLMVTQSLVLDLDDRSDSGEGHTTVLEANQVESMQIDHCLLTQTRP